MATLKRLTDLLDKEKVAYDVIAHYETFTSQETAATEHISGHMMAKVVMLKADGKDCMAVLPASKKLDLAKLRGILGARDLRMATETEFKSLFPDCQTGTMPPFGELYGIPCWMDSSLSMNPFIIFNGGSHTESIKMRYGDYARLAHPKMAELIPAAA